MAVTGQVTFPDWILLDERIGDNASTEAGMRNVIGLIQGTRQRACSQGTSRTDHIALGDISAATVTAGEELSCGASARCRT